MGQRPQRFNQLRKDWLRIYTGEAQCFDKMIPSFLLSINFQEPKLDTRALGHSEGISPVHSFSLSLESGHCQCWGFLLLTPFPQHYKTIIPLYFLFYFLGRVSISTDVLFWFFLRLQLTCPTNILPAATTDSIGDDPIVTSITHPT